MINRPPDGKYGGTTYDKLAVIVRVLLGEDGLIEYVRRLVFTIVCGNSDAHLKNWSLLYPDGVTPTWAPLYDQVATVAWPEVDNNLALKLADTKDPHDIHHGAFERLAERVDRALDRLELGQPARDLVMETVDATLKSVTEAWHDVGGDLPLLPEHRGNLEAHWRSVPLLDGVGLG